MSDGYTPGWAICMMEGCDWRGGSRCVNCGKRLRCMCGRFVREDAFDAHLNARQGECPWLLAHADEIAAELSAEVA